MRLKERRLADNRIHMYMDDAKELGGLNYVNMFIPIRNNNRHVMHAYEHMMFTGFNGYDERESYDILKRNGCDINAYTNYTGIYIEGYAYDDPAGLENILSDMVFNPTLDEKYLKRELDIICNETSELNTDENRMKNKIFSVLYSSLGFPNDFTKYFDPPVYEDILYSDNDVVSNVCMGWMYQTKRDLWWYNKIPAMQVAMKRLINEFILFSIEYDKSLVSVLRNEGYIYGFSQMAEILYGTFSNLFVAKVSKGKADDMVSRTREILRDIIRHPIPKEEFDLLKKSRLKGMQTNLLDPIWVMNEDMENVMDGMYIPYSDVYEATRLIEYDGFLKFMEDYYNPDNMISLIAL